MKAIITFLKKQGLPLKVELKEKKHTLKLLYLLFVDENNMVNTIDLYRKYRAGCRGVFGFDLPKQRPMKKINPIEIQQELF